jgi:hypothetical protein
MFPPPQEETVPWEAWVSWEMQGSWETWVSPEGAAWSPHDGISLMGDTGLSHGGCKAHWELRTHRNCYPFHDGAILMRDAELSHGECGLIGNLGLIESAGPSGAVLTGVVRLIEI